jgi:hypothetical protein
MRSERVNALPGAVGSGLRWVTGQPLIAAIRSATPEVFMGIGLSIFLIAVGAILTFAVHATVNGISIQAVGVILMIAGALGLAMTVAVFGPRRRTSVERTTVAAPVAAPIAVDRPVAQETVVRQHDVY